MPFLVRCFLVICTLGLFSQIANAATVRDETITERTGKLNIEVHYPVLGDPRIDADIADWAQQLTNNFRTSYGEEPSIGDTPYELKANYTQTRSSDRVVTIVWEVGSYTGGAHGNLDIITTTYATDSGVALDLYDIFTDLETALNVMGAYSCKALSETLGDMLNEDMLRGGTTPDADNFSSFAMTPAGVRVFFQPYQVAPWVAGTQVVDIPLAELMDAGPRLELWGK